MQIQAACMHVWIVIKLLSEDTLELFINQHIMQIIWVFLYQNLEQQGPLVLLALLCPLVLQRLRSLEKWV